MHAISAKDINILGFPKKNPIAAYSQKNANNMMKQAINQFYLLLRASCNLSDKVTANNVTNNTKIIDNNVLDQCFSTYFGHVLANYL